MTDCNLEDWQVYLLKDSCMWGHSRVSIICRVSAFLTVTQLQIITFLPATSHCQNHSWEVFGGTSQASKGHIQLHSSGTWSLWEKVVLSFFPVSLSALLLWPFFSFPSLFCPTQLDESDIPLDASFNATKAPPKWLS